MAGRVLVFSWRSIWYTCAGCTQGNNVINVNFQSIWSNICSILWFINTSKCNFLYQMQDFSISLTTKDRFTKWIESRAWSQLSEGRAFGKISDCKVYKLIHISLANLVFTHSLFPMSHIFWVIIFSTTVVLFYVSNHVTPLILSSESFNKLFSKLLHASLLSVSKTLGHSTRIE